MSYYINMALNEGEQAEEYLKRKQDTYDREKNKIKSRTDRLLGPETSDRYHSSEDDIAYNRLKDNPKYKSAAEEYKKRKELKEKYPNAVSNKFLRKDKDFDDAKSKMTDELLAASRVAGRNTRSIVAPVNGYENAFDAVLRHNRRHPNAKLESDIFSECNFIEFAY